MKTHHFFKTMRFSPLTFDVVFLAIAVLLLAQTNAAQPGISQHSQHNTPQQIKLEDASESRWWIVAGAAGGVGFIGLAVLQHKCRMALRRNHNLEEMTPEEDTYFG